MLTRYPYTRETLFSNGDIERAATVRETRREIRAALDEIVTVFNETRDGRVADTIDALVARNGYDDAARIVALLIASSSIYDGRIDDRNRSWAQSVDGIPAPEILRDADIYAPDAIHPAHRDQIADAMRRALRDRAQEPAQAPEIAAQAPEIEAQAQEPAPAEIAAETAPEIDFETPDEIVAAWNALRAACPVLVDGGGHVYTLPALFDPARRRLETSNEKTAIPGYALLSGRPDREYTGSLWRPLREACRQYGVPMRGTCPGCADEETGHCNGCYALAVTRFPHTSLTTLVNTLEARVNPFRFLDLVEAEAFRDGSPERFRVSSGGDLFSVAYAIAVLAFVARHPETAFGTYSKSYDILDAVGGVDAFEAAGLSLQSSPWYEGGVLRVPGYRDSAQFICDDGTDPEIAALPHCPAVNRDGKRTGITCAQCGHCYRARRGDRMAVYFHG